MFCSDAPSCICFGLALNENTVECVDFPSNFCADYPACDRSTGEGCPPGMCCFSTCCPEGTCGTPCGTGAATNVARTAGSGPTLTR
jgi:hypothetical protein